ncbi:MAG: glycosyltransferase [Pseudomonadota bacterium]
MGYVRDHQATTVPLPASDRRGRVCFLINSMEGGGAERAMANLLHYLLPTLDGYDVELLLLDDLTMAQTLPSHLPVKALDGKGSFPRSYSELQRHWSTASNRPDVCVSFLARANVLNVWLARKFGHRAIISERVHTSSHVAASRIAPLLRWITRMSYPKADQVVAVSRGVQQDLSQNYAVPASKISVIGNAIDEARLTRLATQAPAFPLPDDFLLGMGRLVPNKNFSLVLEAYAAVAEAPPLVLLGQGPEEGALREQAARLGIEDRVQFAGFIENPYPIMARARALVSASRAEGFPNTIIEAITLGCPVIATDCPYGPADVITGPVSSYPPWPEKANGILIAMEDRVAMTAAIQSIGDDDMRDHYAKKAKERSSAYGHEAVVNAYTDLILNRETQAAVSNMRFQTPAASPNALSAPAPDKTRTLPCTHT